MQQLHGIASSLQPSSLRSPPLCACLLFFFYRFGGVDHVRDNPNFIAANLIITCKSSSQFSYTDPSIRMFVSYHALCCVILFDLLSVFFFPIVAVSVGSCSFAFLFPFARARDWKGRRQEKKQDFNSKSEKEQEKPHCNHQLTIPSPTRIRTEVGRERKGTDRRGRSIISTRHSNVPFEVQVESMDEHPQSLKSDLCSHYCY